MDHNDNIAVVDYNNHRIQMFSKKGEFLRQIGADSKGQLQFKAPAAIAFNTLNKFFYVIDKQEHSSVQILSSDLVPCGSLGTNLKEGMFSGSSDSWCICCDIWGKVYVANSYKVNVFNAEGGDPIKSIGPLVIYPGGIAFDKHNRMYISSYGGHDIYIFNADGESLKTFGTRGENRGQFNHPRGVVVDCYGIVYVCDMYNNRITMY